MAINPFIYAHAANINNEELVKIFIDNDNSRIMDNNNNVFINGYRGAGKSMLMKYNSFPVKNINGDNMLERIGIYIDCRNPYFTKMDAEFNENKFQQATISESFLVLSMALSLLDMVISIDKNKLSDDLELITNEFDYYFDEFTPNSSATILQDMRNWLNKQIISLQQETQHITENFINNSKVYSYLSLIDVIINTLKQTSALKETHFMFLIDDAILLNEPQQKSINSWVSYRDTSNVSFKVAITSKDEYNFITNHGGIILESHDYIMLDLEKNFFSNNTEFYNFAKKIIEKRFEISNIKTSVDEFFPQSVYFKEQLEEIDKKFIAGEYPEKSNYSAQQRKENVSKYRRAIYFRLNQETPKSNLPELPYTGFDALSNISTGVIRNLLMPCHKMYEMEFKEDRILTNISKKTQYTVLKNESESAWSDIDSLPSVIPNCTEDDAIQLKNMLSNFGKYLKKILLDTSSTEKRILTFTIEDLNRPSNSDIKNEINKILKIGVQSGLLYVRLGADHNGGKTKFYTPNRILWVSLGLDPIGQNGRKPFPAQTFYKMMKNENFSFKKHNENQAELPL